MLVIQNAVLRFLSLPNIQGIKARLLRFCHKQQQPRAVLAAEVAPAAQEAEAAVSLPAEKELREDDLYPAQDDTEDRFAAWEAEQNEKLHEAERLEQKGLMLLSKSALLRAAITCDNRGDTFIANELRELAQNADANTSPHTATGDGTPILRLVGSDIPAKRGA
jgi:hypothetical protein